MKLRVSLAICSVLALLAIRSRAADDTQAPSQPQKRETVAKPMTDKQKKAADAKLRKELESPYKKWLDEEVVWIISDEERAAFKALQTDDERQSFIEDFWRRRDPTPDTEENEFQEEHYRRIAWANDRFASGIPGWKTDRGQIYIKFGPPDENDSHTSGGPGQRSVDEGGGSTTFYPYEIWRYRYLDCCGSDVQIEFIDTTLTNEYRITMDPSEKDALAHIPGAGLTLNEQMGLSSKSDRFTRTDGTELGTGTSPLPERMNMWNRLNQYVNLQKAPPVKFKDLEAAVYSTIKYNLLPLKVRADYVPINGASIQTYLTLQFEDKDLQFSQKEGVSEMKVNVQMRIENMTRKQVVPPIEDVLAMQVPSEMLQKIITGNSAIMQKSVTLLPGRYRLIAAAKDMIGNNTTVYEQALEVPRVDEDTLSTSSLILADVLENVPTKSIGTGQFVIGTSKVRPRMNATFKRDEKMGIYLQLYNFQPDEKTKKADGTVEYQIVKSGSTEKVLDYTEDVKGAASQVVLGQLLPLQKLEPGDYTLTLKVTDNLRNQVVSPSATFKVI